MEIASALMFRIPLFLLAAAALSAATPGLRAAEPALRVAVTPDSLRFAWAAPRTGRVALREMPLNTGADAAHDGRMVWLGDAAPGTVSIPRLEGTSDRLYAQFALCDAASGRALGPAQCVTDFAALPRRTQALGARTSKKGVSCLVDVKDGVALGISQAIENISIAALLDWQSAAPGVSFEFEGRKVGLHSGAVAALDASLRAKRAAGIRVTGILLNYARPETMQASPLVHPLTKAAGPGGVVAAFNTATPEGLFYYRAIVHWLADRYTQEDGAHGWLAGLVIGNEVQSHSSWYYLGPVEPAVLVREYACAMRVADLATRSVHADFPIYISLEHHWMLSASGDPRKGMPGAAVIEGIAANARSGGDFPWNVAFHPYPENLGDPRFWQNKSAPLRFDAPRITFNNLEVLPAFLSQPRFLYEGRPRRIALTEQGFHCPAGPDGEAIQAAAYALAWKKVQALPAIESFMYHRHVDHPDEGGLRCGLREHDGSPNKSGMGRPRKIWEVLQKAGTADEDAAFAFALPILGRTDWSNVVSARIDRPPRTSRARAGPAAPQRSRQSRTALTRTSGW